MLRSREGKKTDYKCYTTKGHRALTATLKCSRLCLRAAAEHNGCTRLCYSSSLWLLREMDFLGCLSDCRLGHLLCSAHWEHRYLVTWAPGSRVSERHWTVQPHLLSPLLWDKQGLRSELHVQGGSRSRNWCEQCSSCPQLYVQHQNENGRQS